MFSSNLSQFCASLSPAENICSVDEVIANDKVFYPMSTYDYIPYSAEHAVPNPAGGNIRIFVNGVKIARRGEMYSILPEAMEYEGGPALYLRNLLLKNSWSDVLEDFAYGLRAVYILPTEEVTEQRGLGNIFQNILSPHNLESIVYTPFIWTETLGGGTSGAWGPLERDYVRVTTDAGTKRVSADAFGPVAVQPGAVQESITNPDSFDYAGGKNYSIDALERTFEQSGLNKLIKREFAAAVRNNIFSQKVSHHKESDRDITIAEHPQLLPQDWNSEFQDWRHVHDVYSIVLSAVEISANDKKMPEQIKKEGSFTDIRAGYPSFTFTENIPLGKYMFDNLYIKLRKDSRFRLFFEYIFPTNRMLGLNAIYNVENFKQYFTDPCAFDSVFKTSKEYLGYLLNMTSKNPSGGSDIEEPYMSNSRKDLKNLAAGFNNYDEVCSLNYAALSNFLSRPTVGTGSEAEEE